MKKIQTNQGLDIMGDGHGCLTSRINLLKQAGYIEGNDGLYRHPEGRKLVYLNDEANKGFLSDKHVLFGEFPSIAMTFMMVQHVKADLAYAVDSNNNVKLISFLEQIEHQQKNKMLFAKEFFEFQEKYGKKAAMKLRDELLPTLKTLPSHIIVENNKGEEVAVIVHAGIKDEMIGHDSKEIRRFCAFGGKNEQVISWIKQHQTQHLIIWGHLPHVHPTWNHNTINIDTGGFCGHYLTMLRFPECSILQEKVPKDFSFVGHNTIRQLQKRKKAISH
jgi:hypothetical protein